MPTVAHAPKPDTPAVLGLKLLLDDAAVLFQHIYLRAPDAITGLDRVDRGHLRDVLRWQRYYRERAGQPPVPDWFREADPARGVADAR